MSEYLLPDVGEGLTEAEIVAWRVKEGDTVAINDIVVEIETAKSIVELPSPFAGVVSAIMVPVGATVQVGTPIIAIDDPSAAAAPAESAPESAEPMEIDLSNPAASGSGEGESLVGRAKAERGPQRRARKGSASPSTAAGAATQMQVQGAFSPGGAQSAEVAPAEEPAVPASTLPAAAPAAVAQVPSAALRVLAKPPVRKLAKDLGVDLASVSPTGPGGVVTRDDVLAVSSGAVSPGAASGVTAGVPAGVTGGIGTEWTEPVKGVRKMMATAMVDSAFTAPHVTEWLTVDVTAGMDLARKLEVSPLVLLMKAVCLAIRRTPAINSTWGDEQITYKSYVNLGVAAATPRGLVVPNIKNAEQLDVAGLNTALKELVSVARDGRTQPADMAGGTFTITNVGVFGVDAGTPIINPGESAILCFGAVKKQPWVVTVDGVDEIAVREVATFALSFDHRHIDGEQGSRFLADVAGIMADPGTALTF